MDDPKIKVDLLKELQSSNAEMELILKKFNDEEKDEDEDENKSPDLRNKSELKSQIKGKRYKGEFKSYSNLESFSLTHTAGMVGSQDKNL